MQVSKDIQELQAQLTKLSKKTDGLLNVREFGAIGDNRRHPLRENFDSLEQAQGTYPHAVSLNDETDWCAIQGALQEAVSQGGGNVHVPAGTFKINRTIRIPHSVKLELNHAAELVATADVDVVRLHKGSQLVGGTINVHSNVNEYSRTCIYISGQDQFHPGSDFTRVSNIVLRNWNPGDRPSGTGIHLYAKGDEEVPNQSICWLHVSNINISWFSKGVYLQAVKADDAESNPGKTAWINGNSFHQIYFHACELDICLEGSDGFRSDQAAYSYEVSGNHFTDIQSQPMSYTMYFSMCGRFNTINGKFWDNHLMESDIKGQFTRTSSYNAITSNLDSYQISDVGNYNSISSPYRDFRTGVIPPAINIAYSFTGNQDDYLAYATARGFVFRQTGGLPPMSGQLDLAFSLSGDESIVWNGSQATENNPIVLELTLPERAVYFSNFGLAFSPWMESPRGIIIRRKQDGLWRTVADHRSLGNQPFFILRSVLAPVEALEIKMWGSNDSVNQWIRLTRIFGQSTQKFGYAYLPRNGGELYGDLDLNRYYLTVGQVGQLPPASPMHRGKMIRVLGDGSATADTVYMCMMSSSGRFNWKPLVQG